MPENFEANYLNEESESRETETRPYFLSIEDFKNKPENPKKFKYGDKVDRDNFTDFIILSFAISRGDVARQSYFLIFNKLVTGFDYATSISNLVFAGGWEALSDEEKNLFIKAYEKIKSHERRGEGDFSESFIAQLQALLRNIGEEVEEKYEFKVQMGIKYGIEPMGDELIESLKIKYGMSRVSEGD